MNPRSRDRSPSHEELAEEARRLGIDVHVLAEDDDAVRLARSAAESGAEALGVAGGDGLAAVASLSIDLDLPFVCIPFGTRNHFARDLGIDRDDPIGALAAFQGRERRVDVGQVGDHLEHRAALVVLVANNDYRLESMADLGERTSLEEGLLHAYVIEAVSRGALLGLLARAVVGTIEEAEGLVEWSAQRFSVESSRARIHAALDGEPVVLASPLRFEVRPRALRALVPVSAE